MFHAYVLTVVAAMNAANADSENEIRRVRFAQEPAAPQFEVLPQPELPAPPRPSMRPDYFRAAPQPYQRSFSQKPYSFQKSYALPMVACPKYCVTYHHHGKFHRSCCGCCKPVKVILPVPDPLRCGCKVDVCVTVPGCMKGYPKKSDKKGLLGRGIVFYDWPNGYTVKVVFKKHEPDVMVHTFAP